MSKQTKYWRQSVLLATAILLGAITLSFAQDAPKFKVGDRVKDPDHQAPATIVKISGGWLTVKYDDTAGEYEIMLSGKLTPLDANNKAPTDKTTPQNAPKDDGRVVAGNNNGEFKVGDRVKIRRFSAQEKLQPCTITRGLKDNSYQVRCDPWERASYMDYGVLPEWVFPWEGATAAPTLDCSFDAPAGAVSKNAVASAPLFKRVIYERFVAAEKARSGMQFIEFQMGTPFKNVMTGHGLLKDAVPENAMIYPVKTKYKTCKEGGGDYNYSQVTKVNFGCYKDRFGDWVCGTDSTPELSDNKDVPKKQ